VSKRRLAQGHGGSYETRTRLATAGQQGLDNFAPAELERWIGSRFDTLLIDCEGCILYVADELLHQVELLILEEDESGPVHVNYTEQGLRLASMGFERFWRHHGSERSTLPVGYHSAWRKPGSRFAALPGCEEYARRMRYSQAFLHCAKFGGIAA